MCNVKHEGSRCMKQWPCVMRLNASLNLIKLDPNQSFKWHTNCNILTLTFSLWYDITYSKGCRGREAFSIHPSVPSAMDGIIQGRKPWQK